MEKLKKLDAKKVASLETIKGGRAMSIDLTMDEGESAGTTVHTATHYSGPDVYICDHKRDK